MLHTNPFSVLAEVVSPLAMQGFIIAMILTRLVDKYNSFLNLKQFQLNEKKGSE